MDCGFGRGTPYILGVMGGLGGSTQLGIPLSYGVHLSPQPSSTAPLNVHQSPVHTEPLVGFLLERIAALHGRWLLAVRIHRRTTLAERAPSIAASRSELLSTFRLNPLQLAHF